MKSNLSLKLFLAFERYFIENDEVISLDKSSEFTDVIVGIGFLPQDMSENTDFKKKTLEKYGFSSSTALADDFRKRVLNIDEPIPENFEKDGIGYVYTVISGYDVFYNRMYMFGIHCFNGDFNVTYYDLENDAETGDYYEEHELYSQAKGYRWLDPESDYYEDVLAWEALNKLATDIYFHLEDKLDVKIDIKPIPEEEKVVPTQEHLAKFLAFCGVEQEVIDENKERLLKALEEYTPDEYEGISEAMAEMMEYSHKIQRAEPVIEIIREYGVCRFSDWKFYAEELEEYILDLADFSDWKWEYPVDTYSADLFPYMRKQLYPYHLWLCHLDEGADAYLFLLFSEKDMPEIMKLARILDLPLKAYFK